MDRRTRDRIARISRRHVEMMMHREQQRALLGRVHADYTIDERNHWMSASSSTRIAVTGSHVYTKLACGLAFVGHGLPLRCAEKRVGRR